MCRREETLFSTCGCENTRTVRCHDEECNGIVLLEFINNRACEEHVDRFPPERGFRDFDPRRRGLPPLGPTPAERRLEYRPYSIGFETQPLGSGSWGASGLLRRRHADDPALVRNQTDLRIRQNPENSSSLIGSTDPSSRDQKDLRGHSKPENFDNPVGNPVSNLYSNGYSNPVSDLYSNGYSNPVNNPFNDPFSNPFSVPFSDPFSNPFSSPFSDPTNPPDSSPPEKPHRSVRESLRDQKSPERDR